ncbi:MAG: hypothetical protein PF495_18330 [Spirochaetales bacterium]|nr:hypothetical protein [Spirochaetales bacterium]
MADAIDKARKKGFVWGENDCCLFSCDIALAITGEDPAKDFRGEYTDHRGSVLALNKYGAGTLRETATQIMGAEISIARAGRGDFVMADNGAGNMLGVCVGESAAFITDAGMVFMKLKKCMTAWRVG